MYLLLKSGSQPPLQPPFKRLRGSGYGELPDHHIDSHYPAPAPAPAPAPSSQVYNTSHLPSPYSSSSMPLHHNHNHNGLSLPPSSQNMQHLTSPPPPSLNNPYSTGYSQQHNVSWNYPSNQDNYFNPSMQDVRAIVDMEIHQYCQMGLMREEVKFRFIYFYLFFFFFIFFIFFIFIYF